VTNSKNYHPFSLEGLYQSTNGEFGVKPDPDPDPMLTEERKELEQQYCIEGECSPLESVLDKLEKELQQERVAHGKTLEHRDNLEDRIVALRADINALDANYQAQITETEKKWFEARDTLREVRKLVDLWKEHVNSYASQPEYGNMAPMGPVSEVVVKMCRTELLEVLNGKKVEELENV